jgi:CelD/BcsL family acetyltransferase involved in cellulose biosynthesis
MARLGPKIRIFRSAKAMLQARPAWESILAEHPYTVFQRFDLNLLAAEIFAGREEPFVVCAESSKGAAIIPAVIRQRQGSIGLLGEELFDYRCFLHQGDVDVLRAAVAEAGRCGLPLEIVAVRENDAAALPLGLPLSPFCAAPGVNYADVDADRFAARHLRLARNLRRLARLGFELHRYAGDYSGLMRFIYEKKAVQEPGSLFSDRVRVEFMVQAAMLLPRLFEIFTLEDEASIATAVVTLRDDGWRRFYTGWFAPELEKHSPAVSLIYEVTRRSLAEGLHCDYMTGEQPYKLRLATSSTALHRVRASPGELAMVASLPHVVPAA